MSTIARPPARVRRYGTIVIGGGQAGLAAGQQLAKRDVDFTVLDADTRVGDSWRRRWDTLRLFSPAKFSSLPDMPFPAPPSHLPDKDEVADYLERYAERFDLPVQLGARVDSLEREGDSFLVHANGTRFECDNVVVGTGAFQRPRIPSLASLLAPEIHQLHSSEYLNSFDLPEGAVLVVGAGPSGAQIALELARFRKVWLAGDIKGRYPRRILGRDLFEWVWPIMRRANAETRLGLLLRNRIARRGEALIGIGDGTLTDAGITRVGRLEDVRAGLPICGEEVLQPRVVVWCTGYESDYRWIDIPGAFDEHGRPSHRRGVSTAMDGLYFIGMRFQYSVTSSLIGGVGEDASFIADQIARRDVTATVE